MNNKLSFLHPRFRCLFGNKGFLAVEVLVVVAIIVTAILAALEVTQKSVLVARQSFHANQAAFLLDEGAEALRSIRDNNWTTIANLTLDTDYYLNFNAGVWGLSATPNTLGVFTRTVRVSSVFRSSATGNIALSGNLDGNARLVRVTVSWSEGGPTITKNLSFYLINIFE